MYNIFYIFLWSLLSGTFSHSRLINFSLDFVFFSLSLSLSPFSCLTHTHAMAQVEGKTVSYEMMDGLLKEDDPKLVEKLSHHVCVHISIPLYTSIYAI